MSSTLLLFDKHGILLTFASLRTCSAVIPTHQIAMVSRAASDDDEDWGKLLRFAIWESIGVAIIGLLLLSMAFGSLAMLWLFASIGALAVVETVLRRRGPTVVRIYTAGRGMVAIDLKTEEDAVAFCDRLGQVIEAKSAK